MQTSHVSFNFICVLSLDLKLALVFIQSSSFCISHSDVVPSLITKAQTCHHVTSDIVGLLEPSRRHQWLVCMPVGIKPTFSIWPMNDGTGHVLSQCGFFIQAVAQLLFTFPVVRMKVPLAVRKAASCLNLLQPPCSLLGGPALTWCKAQKSRPIKQKMKVSHFYYLLSVLCDVLCCVVWTEGASETTSQQSAGTPHWRQEPSRDDTDQRASDAVL